MRHALLAVVLLVALAPRLAAQGAPPPKEGTISINFDGMDLDRILKMVSDELQVRFLYDDKVLKRKVNVLSPVDIPRVHLLSVLQAILEQQGFTMVKAGTPEAEVWKVVPFTQPHGPSSSGRIKTYVMGDTDKLPEGEELTSLAIRLDHVDARSVFIAVQGMASDPRMVQAIESANVVIVTDTAPNIRRIAEVVRMMDVPGHGEPSVSIETCLFDVRSGVLASRGLRIAGSKEGRVRLFFARVARQESRHGSVGGDPRAGVRGTPTPRPFELELELGFLGVGCWRWSSADARRVWNPNQAPLEPCRNLLACPRRKGTLSCVDRTTVRAAEESPMSMPRLRAALAIAAIAMLPFASRAWAEDAQGPHAKAILAITGMT